MMCQICDRFKIVLRCRSWPPLIGLIVWLRLEKVKDRLEKGRERKKEDYVSKLDPATQIT